MLLRGISNELLLHFDKVQLSAIHIILFFHVLVEESYRNTLNKLILLFLLVNFVEWVILMFLTKPDLKILLFPFKNLT